MKNAIILHGTLGSPEGNWFWWLKAELEKQDLQVWLPELPDADRPSLKEWVNYVQKIRQNSRKLFFIHSDDDPYVPLDQAEYVAKSCNAPIVTIPRQGHFNLEQSPGYKEFPKLQELLRTYAIIAA